MATARLSSRLDLAGQVALITGGARGIGRACATTLAEQGAHAIVSDLDGDEAERACSALNGSGHSAEALALDVADSEAVSREINGAVARLGRLDIVVSNAGAGAREAAETLALDDWQRVIDINLTGGFLVARTAARTMLSGSGGAIVFVASIMGLAGGGLYPNAAYHASKGALVNLTRALALEWADRNVRVNAVAPTFARTRLTEPLLADSDMIESIYARTPMGRLVEPEEVAAAVAFLASDAASMITGVTLPVDGGWLAQ